MLIDRPVGRFGRGYGLVSELSNFSNETDLSTYSSNYHALEDRPVSRRDRSDYHEDRNIIEKKSNY